LREWREWFNEAAHRTWFLDYYDVPSSFRRRKWQPIFVLVFGRRDEDPDPIAKLRADLRREDLYVIPYEHLEPNPKAANFLCVRNTKHRYEAVAIPPTVRLGPRHAEHWSLITGKEQAALRSIWATLERRHFLAERFPYWDGWALNGGRILRPRDEE